MTQKPPVRWSIASIPAEAEVLDENGRLLGKTPLSVERPIGPGIVSLTLRLAGYLDKPVVLPLSADTAITERLESVAAPSPGPSAVQDGGTPADLTVPTTTAQSPDP